MAQKISGKKGYLYLRDHESYKTTEYDAYKFGYTLSLMDRNKTYTTYEMKPGKFVYVLEVLNKKAKKVERRLKSQFNADGLHCYYENGGTEFYDKSIIHRMEDELKKIQIEYHILTEQEIEEMTYKKYDHNGYESDSTSSLSSISSLFTSSSPDDSHSSIIQPLSEPVTERTSDLIYEPTTISSSIQPLAHQQEVLDGIETHFQMSDKGQIHWACGLGKALLAQLIISQMGLSKILIGVPSLYLQKQMKSEILRVYPGNDKNIYFMGTDSTITRECKYVDSLTESSSSLSSESEKESIKNAYLIRVRKRIASILAKGTSSSPVFIITTYHSSHYLVSSYEESADSQIDFDMKIGDEAHHLVSMEKKLLKGKYSAFHRVRSKYSLFMTATPKYLQDDRQVMNGTSKIYSMDDEDHFGKVIDKKSIGWAIDNKRITDYSLHVLSNSEYEIDYIIRQVGIEVENKELFISAYMTLKSMEKYADLTHVLVYCNNTENARIINSYVEKILQKGLITFDGINYGSITYTEDDLYLNDLHSRKKGIQLECKKGTISMGLCKCDICRFSRARRGIISSVFIFGEGFDLPRLNGVTFAENMSSEIRIVQSALRPNRMDREHLDKKAYVILPYIDNKEINELGESSFEKCRRIIYDMRCHDDMIEQKIKLSKLSVPLPKEDEHDKKASQDGSLDLPIIISLDDDCEESLGLLKMKLKHSRALPSKATPEEDEYQYMRLLNRRMAIETIQDYHLQKDVHDHYIADPERYFKDRGVWRDWYHFMGYDTSRFIQSKDDWVKFCKELQIKNSDEYEKQCKNHPQLPVYPGLFYKDFRHIQLELGIEKRRR